MSTIQVDEKYIQCLREHLNQAHKMLDELMGVAGGKTSGAPKRKTKKDKLAEMDALISRKGKAGIPAHMKK